MDIIIKEVSYHDEDARAITLIELPFVTDPEGVVEKVKTELSKYAQQGGLYCLEYREKVMHWGASDIGHELQLWLPVACSLISSIISIADMFSRRSRYPSYEVTLEYIIDRVLCRIDSWFQIQGNVAVLKAEETKNGDYYLELADAGGSRFNVTVSRDGRITRFEKLGSEQVNF